MKVGECSLKHWSVTQPTTSLSPAEADAKNNQKRLRGRHLRQKNDGGTQRRTAKFGAQTDSSRVRAISHRLGPGRRATHLEVQTVWVQQLSTQDILKVHNVDGGENEAEVSTEHVPRAVLDKLSAAL